MANEFKCDTCKKQKIENNDMYCIAGHFDGHNPFEIIEDYTVHDNCNDYQEDVKNQYILKQLPPSNNPDLPF